MLRGEDPPPQPPEPALNPALVGWATIHARRRAELAERERALYRELRDEIVAKAEAREHELIDKARPIVEKLAPTVHELSELREALAAVGERDLDTVGAPGWSPRSCSTREC